VAENSCEDTSPLVQFLIIIARPLREALQGTILGCPESNELIGRDRCLANRLGLSELQG
jgi:hypothetical protein